MTEFWCHPYTMCVSDVSKIQLGGCGFVNRFALKGHGAFSFGFVALAVDRDLIHGFNNPSV